MFNELNSVEYFIIHKLSGFNLNTGKLENNSHNHNWKYKPFDKINRSIDDVLIEKDLKDSLINLNKAIYNKQK